MLDMVPAGLSGLIAPASRSSAWRTVTILLRLGRGRSLLRGAGTKAEAAGRADGIDSRPMTPYCGETGTMEEGEAMTITLRPEDARVVDQALQAGIIERADEVVSVGVEALRARLEERVASGQTMNADEWMRKFRAWAHSHPTDTPLLSDDAISRDSIYGDRGL
jgi:hypothetical protein